MPKINHIEIDSLSLEDTNALFDAMCARIAKKGYMEARREILGLSGSDRAIREYKATIADVLSIIALYDLKVTLRVEYLVTEGHVKTGRGGEDFNPNAGLKVDSVHEALSEQAKEITNPELTDLVNIPVVEEGKKKEESESTTRSVPISEDSDLPFV